MAFQKRGSVSATIVQALASVVAFILLSVTGGVLIAGLFVPAAQLLDASAEGTEELFNNLPDALAHTRLPQQSNIYARDGELLATFYNENRIVVPLEEISPWLQKAVVATEDKRFFQHNGVDGEGLLRAVYINLTSEDSPGASTLTQQYVKNTLIEAALAVKDERALRAATETSLSRKLREAKLSIALEERLVEEYGDTCSEAPQVDCGKESILEGYLNIASFGPNIYGVEAASNYYFGKSASELNAVEAATIAGITQNPTKWDPIRHPENNKIRRDTVLTVMLQEEYITRAEYNEYEAMTTEEVLDVHVPKFSCAASEQAPFFCDYVTKIIKLDPTFQGKGLGLLYEGGLDIVTTLDFGHQTVANQELRTMLPTTDPSGFANALVELDPSTGEILAMAQNREYDASADAPKGTTTINYAVNREYGGSRGFSPGSTFKPIILAEYLRSGGGLADWVSSDKRKWPAESWTSCKGVGGGSWSPSNAGSVADQMTVLSATAGSVNTAYAAITNRVDLCNVETMAATLGFERADGVPFEAVPSVVLGTQNASPLTMAEVMATFANKGVHCEPIAILSITDFDGNPVTYADGTVVEPPQPECRQAITPEIASAVAYAMQQVVNGGTGTAARIPGRQVAGKTGTTQNNAHTWFVGYTPQMVAVVWLGHPDQDTPQRRITLNGKFYTRVYGGTLSAPTWQRFASRVLKSQPVRNFPVPTLHTGGSHQPVPLVVGTGMTYNEARHAINDAGYRWSQDPTKIYDPTVPNNTILFQSPMPGEGAPPANTVTYTLSRSSYPSWWTVWPASWNPNVAPKDWWGSNWPPVNGWGPPAGWDPAQWAIDHPPAPDPDPTPSP